MIPSKKQWQVGQANSWGEKIFDLVIDNHKGYTKIRYNNLKTVKHYHLDGSVKTTQGVSGTALLDLWKKRNVV